MSAGRLDESSSVIPEDEITRMTRAVASTLRSRREALKLSKNGLAQKAGISVQSVCFIEDAVNSPSVATLMRLCHALETTPEELLREAWKG